MIQLNRLYYLLAFLLVSHIAWDWFPRPSKPSPINDLAPGLDRRCFIALRGHLFEHIFFATAGIRFLFIYFFFAFPLFILWMWLETAQRGRALILGKVKQVRGKWGWNLGRHLAHFSCQQEKEEKVWTQSSISCWRDNQSPIYDLFSIVSWSFGGWVEKWGWFGDNAVGGFPAACHFPPNKTGVFIIYPQIQAQKARGKVS